MWAGTLGSLNFSCTFWTFDADVIQSMYQRSELSLDRPVFLSLKRNWHDNLKNRKKMNFFVLNKKGYSMLWGIRCYFFRKIEPVKIARIIWKSEIMNDFSIKFRYMIYRISELIYRSECYDFSISKHSSHFKRSIFLRAWTITYCFKRTYRVRVPILYTTDRSYCPKQDIYFCIF